MEAMDISGGVLMGLEPTATGITITIRVTLTYNQQFDFIVL